MSKKLWLISIAVSLMLVLSCIPTSEQIRQVKDGQQVLVSNMDELHTLIKDSKVIDQEKADKLFSEAERVLSQGEEILVAVDGKEGIEMVKAGVEASASWNPYAAPILLAINIIQGLGLFGLGKSNKTKGEALTEIVVGVENLKAGAKPNEAFSKSSTSTRNIVSAIKNRAA